MRIGTTVRVLAGDALVHLEEVAVALLDRVPPEPLDGVARSRDRRRSCSGPTPSPASTIRLAARETPRREGRGCRTPGTSARGSSRDRSSGILSGGRGDRPDPSGTQMRPSLRSDSDMSVSFDWNSSLAGMQVGMDLREARVGEQRAPAGEPARWRVALEALALVERKKTLPYPPVHRTTACAECALDRAGVEVAHDDADGPAVLHHQLEHLRTRVQLDRARPTTCRMSAW